MAGLVPEESERPVIEVMFGDLAEGLTIRSRYWCRRPLAVSAAELDLPRAGWSAL